MRHLRRTVRLTTVLAGIACAVAVMSASASAAISIEPLNTKFEGTSTSLRLAVAGGEEVRCSKISLSGTTEATKSNSVKVTPAITGCKSEPFALSGPTVVCKEKGTVPWTLTLTSEVGAHEFDGSVRLNCSLTLSLEKGEKEACISMSDQTAENALEWFSGESLSELKIGASRMTNSVNAACESIGFKSFNADTMKMTTLTLKGIHVV